MVLSRARWGVLGLCLFACQPGPDDVAPADGVATVSALRGANGLAADASFCPIDQACRDLALNDVLGEGRVVTEDDTVVALTARSFVLSLGPHSAVKVGTRWEIEEGDALIESDGEELVELWVGSRKLKLPAGRPSTVSVSWDEKLPMVAVKRGRAEVVRGSERSTLSRGQTIELADEPAPTLAASAKDAPASPPSPLSERAEEAPSRGLGRMTARRPGQEAVVPGVRLARHDVSVVIQGGVATTTVEEVFHNETAEVLEGRFVFPVPPEASISDLVLWVGDTPVPAEMVEKRRAARIFKGIVDDTVRPKDPALLEWTEGRELSLTIFPIEAKKSRRVRFTFEQPVTELGGAGRFVLPLASGTDRATAVGELSVRVRIEGADVTDVASPRYPATIAMDGAATELTFSQKGISPQRDFVVTYVKTEPEAAVLVGEADAADAAPGILRAALASEHAEADALRADRVLVLDRSASQTLATLSAQIEIGKSLLAALEEDERFAILACDSACDSYPADGLSQLSAATREGAAAWLDELLPAGASDLAGGIEQGARRLGASAQGQLVVLSDGVPSAGALSIATILAELSDEALDATDVRLVGVGRNVDEVALAAIAIGLGGSREPFDPSLPTADAVANLTASLSQPLVQGLSIELPQGVELAAPHVAAARLGTELRVATLGVPTAGEGVTVRGTLQGAAFERALPLTTVAGPKGFASRAVARAQIDTLEADSQPGSLALVEQLSRSHFVMSRHTSLLVLENDAMFQAFGIERTRSSRDIAPWAPRFGGDVPPDPSLDLVSARGNMWGNDSGDAFGAGGLGLSGVGSGGGGKGIGLGDIGTLGHGQGPLSTMSEGTGLGFGNGSGALGGSHRSKPPSVRMGATSVSGRLPPEVIQRIVRQNFGRFRLCYENALRTNPNLSGRVTVGFVIGTDGAVTSASAGNAGIADAGMVSCVVRSFHRLQFPQPEGGVVRVTYPIVFSPEGGSAAPVSRGSWGNVQRLPAPPRIGDGNDQWLGTGVGDIQRLEADVARDLRKRTPRAALVRGLLARGRFAEAVTRAEQYAAVDPDRLEARELLAQALLAHGQLDRSLATLDGLAELDRHRVGTHRRIARAFEASGDERRACAHWTSVAELSPSAASQVEAQRCRVRARGERPGAALDKLASQRHADKQVTSLIAAVQSGKAPAYEWPRANSDDVQVELSCQVARTCPSVVTVDERGRVWSPLLPDAEGRRFAPGWSGGTFRSVLVGGDPHARAHVTVTVRGHKRSVELARAERATALVTELESLGSSFGWGGLR